MSFLVPDRVDSLEEKQKTFFANCRRLKTAEREEEYEKIRRDYAKVIEDSSEKIQNAEESYNLVDRYLRKLDQELHKFKMELEADNRGITEILEKRSLEMDAPAAATSKENRHPKKHVRTTMVLFVSKYYLASIYLVFSRFRLARITRSPIRRLRRRHLLPH